MDTSKKRNKEVETQFEDLIKKVNDEVVPFLAMAVPEAFANMDFFSKFQLVNLHIGADLAVCPPFSACTFVCDYSAHSHYDKFNMDKDAVCILTLCKPKSDPSESQLHLLDQYSTSEESETSGLGLELSHDSILVECPKM